MTKVKAAAAAEHISVLQSKLARAARQRLAVALSLPEDGAGAAPDRCRYCTDRGTEPSTALDGALTCSAEVAMTNSEVAQLLGTDQESVEAIVDELGLENNLIAVDDLDEIDDLLEEDEDEADDDGD